MSKASVCEKLALSFDESPWPKWHKPQMGNLNKDSTHPNPWYPPTQYERLGNMAVPYRIYRHPQSTYEPIKPLRNFLEEDDLITNIGWAAWKSFIFGLAFAANDIVVINNIDTRKARFARLCYLVPPYVGMGVSYVCFREALGNVGKEKNAAWTYPVACIAPGTIWGIVRNSFERGLRFTFFSGVIAACWKWNQQYGGLLSGGHSPHQGLGGYATNENQHLDIDHQHNKFKRQSQTPEGWKGWPFTVADYNNWWTPKEEPGWKKHVSPEEAQRGPPSNQ